MCQSLGEYENPKKYTEKALAIRKEIGDRKEEAGHYVNLGILFYLRGDYKKAKEHEGKALEIRKKIGGRKGEATDYGNV